MKLKFFVPEESALKILDRTGGKPVRVASLDELFKSKALITSARSKSRDWFDLFVLIKSYADSLEA